MLLFSPKSRVILRGFRLILRSRPYIEYKSEYAKRVLCNDLKYSNRRLQIVVTLNSRREYRPRRDICRCDLLCDLILLIMFCPIYNAGLLLLIFRDLCFGNSGVYLLLLHRPFYPTLLVNCKAILKGCRLLRVRLFPFCKRKNEK